VLASRERVAWRLVELTQLLVEAIVGAHQAAQSAYEFVERNELLRTFNGDKISHRVAVDGDAQPLASLNAAQEAGGVVTKFALRDVRSHLPTA
jgi:hypothetical protein